MKSFFLLIRPQQWVKNFFIFLPLFFHGTLLDMHLLFNACVAFLCFCLIASSIYCFNDIYDVEADKQHPKKKFRPIASGKVSVIQAYCYMAFLVTMSLLVGILLSEHWPGLLCLLILYFLMNISYCVKLKHIALVDVFIIAIGFVLRILIGGIVTGIELSSWIVLMTFLLALFLAFAKRRDDVVLYKNTGVQPRKNVNRYNLEFMNVAITITSCITLVCYIMYTVSPEVVARLHTKYLYLTVVFVLAGILRYMQLTIVDVKSGSPTKVLVHDKFIQLCILLWISSFLLIIY